MKYMIIGAGAAGLSAAAAIRKYDPRGSITVLTKEMFEPYSLCSLPSYLSREISGKQLVRFEPEWWKQNKINLKKGVEVQKVKPKKKIVELKTGKPIAYDKLLLAAGSKPIIPPIPGNDLEGIFTLNSLEDCRLIIDWLDTLPEISRAVVIGGGFIGLEAAGALTRRGLSVSIVEMLGGVLPRMVDPDISKVVLTKLKENGVKVKLNCSVEKLQGEKKVGTVDTNKGRIKTDAILWCAGVRPNINMIKGSGIKTNFGINVNSKMQTNKPDIFAAGDLIESKDLLSGNNQMHANWPNAVEQGYIAGSNMAGHSIAYRGTFNINSIDIFDLPVVSIGLTSEEHESNFGKTWTAYSRSYGKDKKEYMNKVMFANGSFSGYQAVGWPKNIGWLMGLLRSGESVPETETVIDLLLNDKPHIKISR